MDHHEGADAAWKRHSEDGQCFPRRCQEQGRHRDQPGRTRSAGTARLGRHQQQFEPDGGVLIGRGGSTV